jgi:hypothetical protein
MLLFMLETYCSEQWHPAKHASQEFHAAASIEHAVSNLENSWYLGFLLCLIEYHSPHSPMFALHFSTEGARRPTTWNQSIPSQTIDVGTELLFKWEIIESLTVHGFTCLDVHI